MDSIIIEGGKQLCGEINISGAKNGALPIMAASLLTEGQMVLRNVPKLTDIETMSTLLKQHGSKISNNKNDLIIDNGNITNLIAPYDIVRKMRASVWVLAPLVARFKYAKVSMPGGCSIGVRQINFHLKVLKLMGATITIDNGYIIAKVKGRLKGINFSFDKSSVGATINAIMAATLASGTTYLHNCAIEPEITDLCYCLVKMGAKIRGIGMRELKIDGVAELQGTRHTTISDRIEAGTYIMAAGITGGTIKVNNIKYDIVKNICQELTKTGMEFEIGKSTKTEKSFHHILSIICKVGDRW